MVARTHPDDSVTIIFEPAGEPVIRVVAPKGRAMLRALVLMLGRGHLAPGDKLAIVAGDETDGEDLPQVSRGSHYGG